MKNKSQSNNTNTHNTPELVKVYHEQQQWIPSEDKPFTSKKGQENINKNR
ncbi:hypothetical protein HNQ80_004098 [Anaerosolibacter carboniphilus]|uniref:Uncharacterized protein n=1 Tax=Anaerosolibacter carboniphilus TaxID=1417629 RepID=A0A841KWY9_9FIRM|nr:hypothetical protein [Anaerosolibacter carboniphilus]MBB6217961.1 hypothetical protein [Anaerosolibacter carboniphilus]